MVFKKWTIKAFIQKILGVIPFGINVNNYLQKNVTKGLVFNDILADQKIIHLNDHINFCTKYLNSTNINVFELGTGWHPIIPIGFYLTGANNIYTNDLRPNLNTENIYTVIDYFLGNANQLPFADKIKPSRFEALKEISLKSNTNTSIKELLHSLNIHYITEAIPFDKSKVEPIQFFCSNNVFEHINQSVLDTIIEFQIAIADSSSVHSHFIDMSDHYAHFDQSINIYNFLKYNSKKWHKIDNNIQPQNRLREVDFIKLFKNKDLELLEYFNRPGDKTLLTNVSEEFKENYSIDELAVSHTHLVFNMVK